MKLHFFLITFCCASFCQAQQKNYTLGNPLDISSEGWNIVLSMKSGNTLLFHFDAREKIVVKAFDSTHKLTATREDDNTLLDMRMIEYAVLKGAYDIGGDAVLFFDQMRKGSHELLLLRYSGATGKLIEERKLENPGDKYSSARYYVMKDNADEGYSVLFCTDRRRPKQTEMVLVLYNKGHEAEKQIPLTAGNTETGYTEISGAECQRDGILITLTGGRGSTGKSEDTPGASYTGGAPNHQYLTWYYLPKGDSRARVKTIDLGAQAYPYYSFYTGTTGGPAINALVFNYKPLYAQFGMNMMSGSYSEDLFFRIHKDSMAVNYTIIKDSMANGYLKQQTDTTNSFVGIPLKMYTDEQGLSTLISGAMNRHKDEKGAWQYDENSTSPYIGITQFDDRGREIWGTVLPCFQYYSRSPRYSKQFIGVNVYEWHENYYIVFNDYSTNFNNSLKEPGKIEYLSENTNACYYKINGKREISKEYVFGRPRNNEYKSSFTQTADFDPQRGVYAALILYKKDGEMTLRMAWSRLE